jgi:hypothetical protein
VVNAPVAKSEEEQPDCFEMTQNFAFAANSSCRRVGLFSSEGRAALRLRDADIRAAEKEFKDRGRIEPDDKITGG